MPIYEYRHTDGRGPECEEDLFEVFGSIKGVPLEICPQCGKKVHRILSVPAVGVVVEEGNYSHPDHGELKLPANKKMAKAAMRDFTIKNEGEEKADSSEFLAPDDYGR